MNKDSKLIWEAYTKKLMLEEAPAQPVNTTNTQTSQGGSAQIRTFGDLSKIIRSINFRGKGKAVLGQGADFAINQLLGLIPGASNAKTAFDFFKAVIAKPDTKKTNTVLDKLDIDDEVLKIIDNTVEASFLQHLEAIIARRDQNTPIPADWNMTKELHDYIKATYRGRSIEVPR
jgi:hypothetical protein